MTNNRPRPHADAMGRPCDGLRGRDRTRGCDRARRRRRRLRRCPTSAHTDKEHQRHRNGKTDFRMCPSPTHESEPTWGSPLISSYSRQLHQASVPVRFGFLACGGDGASARGLVCQAENLCQGPQAASGLASAGGGGPGDSDPSSLSVAGGCLIACAIWVAGSLG